MAIREGKWRCPYCSVVNRGRDLACTGCGATRDKDVSFFLEDEAPEVDDEALAAAARGGADWLCQFCQTSNRPASPHCRNCGAERGTSPSRPVRDLGPPEPPPAPLAAAARGCGLPVALTLLLVTGFCAIASYFFFLRRTEEPVTISGFEWRRTVEVEAYRTVRDSAWVGDLPAGGRPISRAREVHHTEREQVGTRRVKVGTKDLGNGFFEDVYEDEPVYKEREVFRDKVTYEIERWVPDRVEKAEGNDRVAHWPIVRLGPGEREAKRTEFYVVLLQGKKKLRLMEVPKERWSSLQDGEAHTAIIRGGRVIELR